MSTTKVTIEVIDSNPFNEGWLLFLLGQPRPPEREGPEPEPGTDPDRAAMDVMARADGWDMGKDTPTVGLIRRVFDGSGSVYAVTVEEPVAAAKEKESVTE